MSAFAAASRGFGWVLVCAYCFLSLWGAHAIAEDIASPPENITPPAEDAASPAEDTPRFDVWEFRVTGNTLLTTETVERALYRFLGAGKTVDDVKNAAASLEREYVTAGYHLVNVGLPEQEVAGGVVRLEVVEGRLQGFNVSGSRYFSPVRIRSRIPALKEGEVVHLPSFQAQLMALNTVTADRAVTPIFRPGLPGMTTVELRVDDRLPLHGSIELNDRYSLNTSRLRLDGKLSYTNLWQREHTLSLQYQTSPTEPDEVQVWGGTYVWPGAIGSSLLAMYGVRSESRVAALGDFQVLGTGDIVGLRLITPFDRIGRYGHSLTLGVDYKDLAEDLSQAGSGSVPVTTPISYLPFTLEYGGAVAGEQTDTRFDVGLHFGLRGLGDGEIDCEFQQGDGSIARQRINEFACKRAGAKPNFIVLAVGAEHNHRGLPWGFALHAALKGQLADSPLVSNEQMSAGGVDSVRGYVESERLGDAGVRINLELHSPSLLNGGDGGHLKDLRAALFADAARLKVRDTLPGQAARHDLSSVGLGLNARAWDGFNASLLLAWPFTNAVQTDAGEPRLHFAVGYAF